MVFKRRRSGTFVRNRRRNLFTRMKRRAFVARYARRGTRRTRAGPVRFVRSYTQILDNLGPGAFGGICNGPREVTTNEVRGAMTFRLDYLNDFAEITTLFDRYRIDRAVVRFYPQITSNSRDLNTITIDPATSTAVQGFNPRIFIAKDYDDSAPVSIGALRQYPGVRIRSVVGPRPFKVVLKPACLSPIVVASGSTTNASAGPKWGQWIDVANVGIPHFGLKYAIEDTRALLPAWSAGPPIANQVVLFKVETKLYFTCAGIR